MQFAFRMRNLFGIYKNALRVNIASDNDADWTTIFAANSSENMDKVGKGIKELNLLGRGQYVRIRAYTSGTTNGYSLFNFEVYGNKATSNASIFGNEIKINTNVTDYINVDNLKFNSRVNVYSTFGRLLYSKESSGSLNIPVLAWARGMYVVSVNDGNQTINRKIMLR